MNLLSIVNSIIFIVTICNIISLTFISTKSLIENIIEGYIAVLFNTILTSKK